MSLLPAGSCSLSLDRDNIDDEYEDSSDDDDAVADSDYNDCDAMLMECDSNCHQDCTASTLHLTTTILIENMVAVTAEMITKMMIMMATVVAMMCTTTTTMLIKFDVTVTRAVLPRPRRWKKGTLTYGG